MRRAKLEVTDKDQILQIIKRASICHIGLCDGDKPYVFPVNFGFKNNVVYIHCAKEGRKIDLIKKNPNACVEMVGKRETIGAEKPCDFHEDYESVIGNGKAGIVENYDEKLEALWILMAQYSEKEFEFDKSEVDKVGIIRIELNEISGKVSR